MKTLFLFFLLGAAPTFALEYNENIILKELGRSNDAYIGKNREKLTRIYNTLNPYYVEVCTTTQYLPKIPRATKGGTGGHATIFINGACVDDNKPYPQLKMCEQDSDLVDANTAGVGVSLNLMFSNVRFVAIPGRGNFYSGPAAIGEKITPEVVEKTRDYYVSQPWHNGIRLAEEHIASCGCAGSSCTPLEQKKCIIDKNTGIDFAITYARNSYCTRLAMPEKAISKVVSFLNSQNSKAYEISKNGERGYTYDVTLDNCSHLIHNAIASTGFFDRKKSLESSNFNTFRGWFSELAADVDSRLTDGEFGYSSVPIHNVNRIANRSIDLQVDNIKKMYKNKDIHKTLFDPEYSWLPSGSGNMIAVISKRDNNTSFDLGEPGVSFFLGGEEFDKLVDFNDSEFNSYYSNLCKNLTYHKHKLYTALVNSDQWLYKWKYKQRDPDKTQFIETYQKALRQEYLKSVSDFNYIKDSCQD